MLQIDSQTAAPAAPPATTAGRTLASRLEARGLLAPLRALAAELAAAADSRPGLARVAALLGDDVVERLFREEVQRHAGDDRHSVSAGVFRSNGFVGVTIYEDANLFVVANVVSPVELAVRDAAVATAPASARNLAVVANDTLIRFVRAQGAQVRLWESDPIGYDTALDAGARCRDLGLRTMQDGEDLFLAAGTQNCTIEAIACPLVMLSVTAKRVTLPVVAEYVQETGLLAAASAADERSSRIQMLATFLRSTAPERVVTALVPVLQHRDHFVRWHLMREMLASDVHGALPGLRDMAAADPHPQVRAVAKTTLRLVEEKLACP